MFRPFTIFGIHLSPRRLGLYAYTYAFPSDGWEYRWLHSPSSEKLLWCTGQQISENNPSKRESRTVDEEYSRLSVSTVTIYSLRIPLKWCYGQPAIA